MLPTANLNCLRNAHGADRPCPRDPWLLPIVLLAVVAGSATMPRSSCGEQRRVSIAASSQLDAQPPRVMSVVDDFETQFVELVAAAKQHQAEQLLDQQLAQYPRAQQLVEELAAENVARAMFLNLWHRRELQAAQRLLFLKAACERSCFDVARASATFAAVGAIDPKTVHGRVSLLMVRLDAIEPTLANWPSIKRDFGELQKIVSDNPHDPMLLWMLAIECRQWNHNKLGVGYYRELLSRWQPGPPLVHQTYANLLDNLKLYDEALAERRIAVAQAPTHWTYAGLANTLAHLHRFDESFAAHAEATRRNPHKPQYWVNWAIALNNDHRHEQAIDKCKRALALDRNFEDAYWNWARALKDQDKFPEALAKYRELQSIIPNSTRLKKRIAEMEPQLAN